MLVNKDDITAIVASSMFTFELHYFIMQGTYRPGDKKIDDSTQNRASLNTVKFNHFCGRIEMLC